MLTRRNSGSSLVFDRLDKMMDEAFGEGSLMSSSHLLPSSWFSINDHLMNVARHPVHTTTTNEGVKIEFDVPGSNKEDLEISYDEISKNLTVSSKTEKKSGTNFEVRTFSYSYLLHGYDPNSIEATCDKGVLVITAKLLQPKKDNSKRTIEIK